MITFSSMASSRRSKAMGSAPRRVRRRSQQPRPATAGLTILEVLVGVLIASVSIALLIPGWNRQMRYVQDSSRMAGIESVIARDLEWIRMYARYWKMKAGPYQLMDNSFTKASSYRSNTAVLDYEPPVSACDGESPVQGRFLLADLFLQDAASLSASSDANAKPPFAIRAGTFSDFSGLPADVMLQRTITPMGSRVVVSYDVSGSVVDNLYLDRRAALLIQAAAWCDKLQ